MNNLRLKFLVIFLGVSTIVGCKKEEETTTTPTPPANTSTMNLSMTGLENLGDDFRYEGWIMVDGSPVSAGIFSVNDMGELSTIAFAIDTDDLNSATAYILTIEPHPDSDPNPSSTHILAGDFSGDSSTLSLDHGAALGNDFTSATGGYILATPTDGGMMSNENSGVWWLDPTAGPGAGLDLPTLPAGWEYEGWAVIDGVPVTTGKFLSVTSADDLDTFSSATAMGPPFPGEDFLMNAPTGVTFPTDLVGKTVVISVEPMPDNGSSPFLLKPLVGMVPTNATDHTFYTMDNNADNTNPTGVVSR